MQKKGSNRKSLIIGIIAAIVVLGVVLALVLTQCTGQGESTAPSTTVESTPEVPTYELYWNADRELYEGKSEAGMSSRMPESDGYFHVRFILDGEEVILKVQDRKIINKIDVMDIMGLEFDENGIVVDAFDIKEMPLERIAWQFYVQSAGKTLIKANSSESFGGMEVQLELDGNSGVYDMTGKEGPLGCIANPMEGDRIYGIANLAGEITHVFIYERPNFMLTHEAECQHCEKTVTWYEWTREDKLPVKSGHYQLQNDITLSGQMSMSEQDQKICLDLNGYRVDGKNGSRMYSLHNAGSHLAIMDTSEEQTGVLAAHGKAKAQGVVVWVRYGQFHLYSGTLDASDVVDQYYGVAVQVPKNAYMYMYGGTIIGGTSTYVKNTSGGYSYGYGGSLSVSGKFVMHDGVIRDGFAQSVTYTKNGTKTTTRGYGGNLFVTSTGEVELNGGVIKNGKAGSAGGNIYMDGACTVTLNGTKIQGGTVTGSGKNGGSIYITSKATLNMKSGSITGGVSYNAGGNIYVNGVFNMSGGSVYGGKCYNYTTKKLNESSTNYNLFVVNGTFKMYGGRIYGGVGVTDTSLTDNKTAYVGLATYATIKSDEENATNLTLNTGGKIVCRVDTLRDSASIGVNTARGIFTDPTLEANRDNFFSDIKEAEIIYTEKGLALGRMNCVCGKEDTHINGCDGTMHLWSPWISATSLPKNEGNYYLIKEVTTTSQTIVTKGDTVRLDLNGFNASYKVAPTSSDGFRVYRSAFESLLVITDTTNKPGTIRSLMPTEAEVLAAVQAKVDDGTYTQADADKRIEGQKAGNFGQIIWARGGDVILHNGILDGSNLNGSKNGMTLYIAGNTASEDGGVSRGGSFTMYGGTIKGATSTSYGSSIQSTSSSSVTIHGGVIEGGVSTANAGGNVYVSGSFYMDGGIIRDGVAYSSGGNLVIDGSKAKAVITGNAQILNGQAGDRTLEKDIGRGGNIRMATTGATLELSGNAVISGGKVYRSASNNGGFGGNISVNTGTVMTMTGGTVKDGISDYRAGNIDVCGILNLSGGTVTEGQATLGGNIYVLSGSGRELNITGGTIDKGHATNDGGNIYALGPVNMSGGLVADGKALPADGVSTSTNTGGNIYIANTMVITGDAVVRDGFAGAFGGNIYTYKNSSTEIADVTISGNAKILDGVADAQKVSGIDAGTGGNIRVGINTSLTLKDDALISGGRVVGGGAGGGHGGNICISSSTIQMLGGVVEKGSAPSGGGNISGNAPEATVILDGVIIRDGEGGTLGGNIRALGSGMGLIQIKGDTQILNGTSTTGGNIYLGGTNRVEMSGGKIAGGQAAAGDNGGNVWFTSNTTFLMSGDAVIDGTGSVCKRGGAVYMNGGVFSMTDDAQLIGSDESAVTHGGAAYLRNNVTLSGNACILGGSSANYGGAVYFHSGAMTLEDDASIDATSSTTPNGAAIYMYDTTSDVTLKDNSRVIGGTSTGSGACIYISSGKLTIDGATLVGGTTGTTGTANSGGAIYATGTNSSVTMNSGTILGGQAKYGGAVYIYNGATFTMNDGTIRGGRARSGGAVAVEANANAATFTMNGGTIEDGQAVTMDSNGQGGNVWLYGNATGKATFTMNDGTIRGGISSGHGGNIYAPTNTVFTMKKGQISDGIAEISSGGNVYLTGAFTLDGGAISGGTNGTKYTGSSKPNGGSVYVGSAGTFYMNGGSVTGGGTINTGGNFVVYGHLEMTDGTISGGKKVDSSGATTNTTSSNLNVYVVNGTMKMTGGSIDGRTALYGSAKLTLSGNAVIHTEDEGVRDLYLNGTTEPITIEGALGSQSLVAEVGLAAMDTNVFSTVAPEGSEKYFTSYDKDLEVFRNAEGKLELGKVQCICGFVGGKHIGDCDGTEYNWSAWTSTSTVPTTTGYYYLTSDVQITGSGVIKANNQKIALDLNGYTVYGTAGSSRVYTTYNSGTYQTGTQFTLINSGDTGMIQGWNKGGSGKTAGENGSIIWAASKDTVINLYNITLDGSKNKSASDTKYGMVVSLTGTSSKLNIFSSKLLGGTAAKGDAIGLITTKTDLKIRMEGDITVTGTEGSVLFMGAEGNTIDVSKVTSLNAPMSVEGTGVFTTGWDEATMKLEDYFVSGDENATIVVENGELAIRPYHCICGMPNGKHVEDFCDEVKYVWEPWTSTTTVPNKTGHYYLTANVTANANTINTEQHIVVDLNGFNINSSKGRIYTTQYTTDRAVVVDFVLTNTKTDDESIIKVTGGGDQGRIVWLSGYNKSLKVYNLTIDVTEAVAAVSGQAFSGNAQKDTQPGEDTSIEIYNTNFLGADGTGTGIGNMITLTRTNGLGQSLKLKDVTMTGGYGYRKLTDGTLEAQPGGAVSVYGGNAIFENVTINGSQAGTVGGAIYLGSKGSAVFSGKIILDGKLADGTKSGVYVLSGGTLDVEDLAADSVFGISGDNGVISANTYTEDDADLTYITVDNSEQFLLLVDGKLNLKGTSCICGMPGGKHVSGFCDGTLRSWKLWSGDKAPTESGNYILTGDVTFSKAGSLTTSDASIVLDLNGHDITVPAPAPGNAGRLYTTYTNPSNSYAVSVKFTNTASDTSTIKVEGAGDEGRVMWLTGSNKSLGIYNVSIDLSGASIANNARKDGLGINVSGSGNTFAMYDCTVTGGTSTSNGNLLYLGNGNTATLERCTVTGTKVVQGTKDGEASGGYGGFAYIRGALTMNDCSVTGATSAKSSGAIYCYGSSADKRASIVLNNCTFSGCEAGGNGGAMDLNTYADAQINNCTFDDCHSVGRAGAVHVGSGCEAVMNGTTVKNCSVTGTSRGGALYSYQGTLTLIDCTLKDNASAGSDPLGGAVYLYGADLTLGGKILVTGNTAGSAASGIYLNGRKLLVSSDKALTADSVIAVSPEKNKVPTISVQVPYAQKDLFVSDLDTLQIVHDGTNLKFVDASEHWHCVCGGQPTGDPDHKCKDIKFEAIDALSGGTKLESGNYYLTKDMTVSGSSYVQVADGKTVSLCLADHTLTGHNNSRLLYVSGTGELTVTSCDADGNSATVGTLVNASTSEGNVIGAYGTSVVNMYNITMDASGSVYTSTSYGNAINFKGTFNMYSGTIIGSNSTSNKTTTGAVAVSAGAVMNMYGGTIRDGSASDICGNVYVSGTLNMMGGTITGGKLGSTGTNSYQANIRVIGTGVLNMTGGTITGHVNAGVSGATVKLSGDAKILHEGNRGLWIVPGRTTLMIGDLTDKAQLNLIIKDSSDNDVFGVFAVAMDGYTITEQDVARITATNTSGAKNGNVVLNTDNTLSVEKLN